MAVKIDLKATTIDFDFGGLIIQADTSDSSLAKMIELKESEKFKEIEQQMEKVKNTEIETLTQKEFAAVIENITETIDIIYTPIFGAGSFKKLYQKTDSLSVSVEAFESAIKYIGESYAKEQNKKSENYRSRKNKRCK